MVLVLFLVFPTWTVTYGSLEPVLSFACRPWAHKTRKTGKKKSKRVSYSVHVCVRMRAHTSGHVVNNNQQANRCCLNHLPFCSAAPQTTPVFLSIFMDTKAQYAASAVFGSWRCSTNLPTCDADLG